jgi:putative transposase
MQYRRYRIAGGTYFFTVNLADRSSSLLVEHIDLLRYAVREVKSRHPFTIDAIVILPDHIHAIWTLSVNDVDYSKRWMLIKSMFSRHIPKTELINDSRMKKRERGIWQRRFWEHTIRDEFDWQQHVDYIHNNPVKHGWVKQAIDWPYSSLHSYLKADQ